MKKIITLLNLILCTVVIYAQETSSNIEVLRDSVKISSLSNIQIKANGKVYYNNKEIATKDDVGRCATFVIAASNTPAKLKVLADAVCTGTNDQQKIQDAVNNIASWGVGGKIQLMEGDYYFNNGVGLSAVKNNKALSITIEGMGSSTVLHRQYSSEGKIQGLFAFGIPVNSNITNKCVTTIKNLKYNGHVQSYPSTVIQTFVTSYTKRSDVLETTVCENIVCENVDDASHLFIIEGSHAIMKSLDLGNARNGYGMIIYPSGNQQGNILSAIVDNCITPLIYLKKGNYSLITNNVVKFISLDGGEKVICSGNIYNSLANGTVNSLISNNLQVGMP